MTEPPTCTDRAAADLAFSVAMLRVAGRTAAPRPTPHIQVGDLCVLPSRGAGFFNVSIVSLFVGDRPEERGSLTRFE